MNNIKITLTGDTAKTLISKKTGKEFYLLDVFVHTGAPYPEKIAVFEDLRLPRGIYDVPMYLQVNNGRLEIRFDFKNAKPIGAK